MAIAYVEFGAVHNLGEATIHVPTPRKSEAVTTSASNASTTNTARVGEYARVSVSGGAVYVTVGSAPDATSAPRRVILDGGVLEIGPLGTGAKLAFVNV